MVMTLRLTDEETALLRRQAQREGRSMHEVVRLAIQERIASQDHTLGVRAVRDIGLLDWAAHRPRASAFGKDAYPTVSIRLPSTRPSSWWLWWLAVTSSWAS